MPAKKLTVQQLGDVLDVDPSTIRRWIKKGCPSEGKGLKRRFDEAAVAAWMVANNVTGKVGKPSEPISEEIKAANLRKVQAMALSWELDNKQKQGLLVEKAEVEKASIAKITLVKNRLLGLGAKLAAELDGLNGAERQQRIDDEVQEILNEFSRG